MRNQEYLDYQELQASKVKFLVYALCPKTKAEHLVYMGNELDDPEEIIDRAMVKQGWCYRLQRKG